MLLTAWPSDHSSIRSSPPDCWEKGDDRLRFGDIGVSKPMEHPDIAKPVLISVDTVITEVARGHPPPARVARLATSVGLIR
ncbi:hypothetical protein ACQEUX_05895 [Micromonospora sp. CA-259024]|uniref:hypothetical protein n=1 Tax=Micromonospora sp. CA-259024 TaxID=3239965 RepID=UPI003D919989